MKLKLQLLIDSYQQQKNWVFVFILNLFIFLLFYFFDLSHLQQELSEIRLQNMHLETQIKQLQLILRKTNTFKHLKADLTKNLQDSIKQVSTTFDFSVFLKIAGKAAKLSEVNVDSITPQNEYHSQDFIIKPIEVLISGSYAELANFIFYLCKSQILFLIKQMDLQVESTDDSKNKQLNMKVIFEFYSINNFSSSSLIQNKKMPNLSYQKSKLVLSDPFNFANFKDKTTSLTAWQVQDLQMIGSIIQDNKTWGVVLTPIGETYHVAIGDLLGKNKSKIVRITASEIYTSNENDFLLTNNN